MKQVQHILNTLIALIIIMMATETSYAQPNVATAPNAVYYVCAEQGFKLTGPAGYDNYMWSADSTGMPGADSINIMVAALGDSAVGNSAVKKTYHLKVMNNGSCWSNEATYVVYVLPKMQLTVSGYSPPYCEHLSHEITLTAKINGDSAATALNLPTGVGVQYSWFISNNSNNLGNAEIDGPVNQANAQVVTPGNTAIDNYYTIQVQYTYPSTVNTSTDVVGSCNDSYTQDVHANPAPQTPTINAQPI